ncbi:hypothetical protein PIB30_044003, partial [Stylosanthes scabra]|nr:hypothetical protein [Stylosanthes scabra]
STSSTATYGRTPLFDPPLEKPLVKPRPKPLTKKLKQFCTFFVLGYNPQEISLWSARYRQEHGLPELHRRPRHPRSCEDSTNDTSDLSSSKSSIPLDRK